MTDREINLAIAEACGWKWYRRPATGIWANKPMRTLYHPLLVPECVSTLQPADMTERECNAAFIFREGLIPDYANDLNAMRSARESLSEKQLLDFFRALERIVERDAGGKVLAFAVGRGTAHQEVEAFLRTLGKWREA